MKYLITEDGKDKTYSLPTVWNNVKLDSYMKAVSYTHLTLPTNREV